MNPPDQPITTGGGANGSNALQTITYAEIKDLIPSYSGEASDLEQFISTVDTLYIQMTDDHNRKMLLLAIKSKFKGKAYDAVKNLAEIVSWRTLRRILREKIVPVSPEHAYTQLAKAKQREKESIAEFASRIESMLNTLNRTSADIAPESARDYMRNSNAHLAHKAFVLGLSNRDIRTIAVSRNADSLALSTQEAIELEASGRFAEKANNSPNKQADRPTKTCGYCKKAGHTYEDCRKRAANKSQDTPKTDKPPSDKTCNYCKKTGHTIDQCFKRKPRSDQPPTEQPKKKALKAQKKASKPTESEADEQKHVFTLEELKTALQEKNC